MGNESNKNFGIILIDRSRMEYFDMNVKKQMVFNFSPNLVRDLEVINRIDLEKQIILFINFYKLNPQSLVIVLSEEVIFEILVDEVSDSQFELTLNNFLYHLPFEETIHKIYRQPKGYRIVAVNKDLIETIRHMFIKMGFYVEAIVPTSIIGINVKTLDLAAANFISAKLNMIKDQTLVTSQIQSKPKNPEEKQVFGIKRVFILLTFFSLLLILLLFMLYRQTTPFRL
ncbi:hypothetical protein A3D05_05425 [Candidatus Gottesmanbacteria bacterium RIFCSPHIGHO2_02_FULL_40_24]|uniref:Uncharacterized protein n=1 Tax=Candidatus Gottesmanbacteria bacterium RIFCSPHIGHO2_01_FULL_40_15 TaxID=1798376 RepID=A0A1F5Z6S8_9BACT|nr:MAG: hypothetical protein A2777_02060 [Candidatus Gottesmanbacteria bacterium RIFCSPHIGHO2_01_FULL_40_15]OGG16471.1 MAG: hypothetical protein A3D05_05425 [Candidatus Gottesmanbacteria bacterium RIFCSPHIGHO2_02_FULL_40_24]